MPSSALSAIENKNDDVEDSVETELMESVIAAAPKVYLSFINT